MDEPCDPDHSGLWAAVNVPEHRWQRAVMLALWVPFEDTEGVLEGLPLGYGAIWQIALRAPYGKVGMAQA